MMSCVYIINIEGKMRRTECFAPSIVAFFSVPYPLSLIHNHWLSQKQMQICLQTLYHHWIIGTVPHYTSKVRNYGRMALLCACPKA